MSEHHGLEDSFLTLLSTEKVPVSIFLVNGIKLHGVIGDVDEHVIILNSTIPQMVYKHAISTVVPSRVLTPDAEE